MAITEGASWNPLGLRNPQHVATRPFNAPPSNSVEEDPLGNWDTFLIASQVCSGQEALDTMGAVKAFYISNGFHKPRNLVGLSESILKDMIKAIEDGEYGSQNCCIPRDGINLRLRTCLHQVVSHVARLAEQSSSMSNSRGDQGGGCSTGKPLELSNNSINALKMMGTGAMAHTVLNSVNAVKVTPCMIPRLLRGMSVGKDIEFLPIHFNPSTDVFSILMTDCSAASRANKQAFSYFLLTDDAFQPRWLPPEAIGGIAHFIKEDMFLATGNQTKDALTMINGLNKSFDKMRFFRKKEHWILAWTRILPALLASHQWTLVAWMIHLDHICKLYELNKSIGSDYLITLYEDQLRKHFHDRCQRGERINLATECGTLNVDVMDACKTRLHSTLHAAGLSDRSAQRQYHESHDSAASGTAKHQAMWDADHKKTQLQSNAMLIREDSFAKKMQALQLQPHQAAGKFAESWNSSNRGRVKCKGKNNSQRHQQQPTEEHAFSSQVHLDLKPNSGWQTGGYKKQKGKSKGDGKKKKGRSAW